MADNIIEVRDITKEYDGSLVLKGISFNVEEGEFITLLGPSGCGKTTTLRIIGGFEKPNSGEVLFEQKNLLPIKINNRQINTIFQSYALFPHLDVFENVAFGLRNKHTKNEIVNREVMRQLRQVGLESFAEKNINELSGGQKQRVAIARALVMKPRVLLLDEPMAALDVHLRKNMQDELKRLQRDIGITFIMVTHDQEEALAMSDHVIVMNKGTIQQIGTPEEIYNEPKNIWVAKFVGVSNVIENGVFVKDNLIEFDGKKFECVDINFGTNEENIDIVIHPEDINLWRPNVGFFNGTVLDAVFKGIFWEYTVKTTKKRIWVVRSTSIKDVGEKVSIKWSRQNVHVMWKTTPDN